MTFEIIKILGWLTSPLTLAMFLLAGSVIAAWRSRPSRARILGLAVFVWLWVVSMPLTMTALILALERMHPALPVEDYPAADAIIVLGGGVAGYHMPMRPHSHLSRGATRVWLAAQLWHAGKADMIVVSGGDIAVMDGIQRSADATRNLLVDLGVPTKVIHLESLSRNTIENARNSSELIGELEIESVLLVTSASHMPRAHLLFQYLVEDHSLDIVPVSTDVVAVTLRWPQALIPDANTLDLTTRAWKEWIGFLALRSANALGL